MGNFQKILFVCLYTLLFSLLLFIGREIFFSSAISHEEIYLEASKNYEAHEHIDDDFYEFSEDNGLMQERAKTLIYESFREKFLEEQAQRITFRYVPTSLENEVKNTYTPLLEVFLYQDDIFHNISKLGVFLYQNIGEVRGRMKSGNIHLYGIQNMGDEEFLSVFIHEFGHYFDIYSLTGDSDISQKFYDISWKSPTVIQEGMSSQDFVSGYALTNQYEDFSETYVYFILHNQDFFNKSRENIALGKKYNFFHEYIFDKGQFQNISFSFEGEKQEYYWDITKIRVDTKNFLQYIQNNL